MVVVFFLFVCVWFSVVLLLLFYFYFCCSNAFNAKKLGLSPIFTKINELTLVQVEELITERAEQN